MSVVNTNSSQRAVDDINQALANYNTAFETWLAVLRGTNSNKKQTQETFEVKQEVTS